jgi:hypothetical protein
MRAGRTGSKNWRRRNGLRQPPMRKSTDYFLSAPLSGAAGVAGVADFFSVFLSLQPTKPIENKLNTKTEARMRFIFPFLR